MSAIELHPVRGIPLVRPGDDLAGLLIEALEKQGTPPQDGDVLVVCQKIVSKAKGRVARYTDVEPSAMARTIASETGKDARILEVILGETRRIVRMDQGHLIVETRHGWVCANAGVDESNGPDPETLVLLPEDPDASARGLCERLQRDRRARVAVVITDTFGRPWREGLVEVAIGAAGIAPLLDHRGRTDLMGRELHHTVVSHLDELAAAAGLLMGKSDGIPAVLIRGYPFETSAEGARVLVRKRENDLFR